MIVTNFSFPVQSNRKVTTFREKTRTSMLFVRLKRRGEEGDRGAHTANPRNRAARSQFTARIRGRRLWVYQPVYYLITIKIYTPSFATVNCIIECIPSGSSRSYASLSSPASPVTTPFCFPWFHPFSLSRALTLFHLHPFFWNATTTGRKSFASRPWWLSWISLAYGNLPVRDRDKA